MGKAKRKSSRQTPESVAPLQALQELLAACNDEGVILGGIAANHPNLDKERIQYWGEQFDEVLETGELWQTISHLL